MLSTMHLAFGSHIRRFLAAALLLGLCFPLNGLAITRVDSFTPYYGGPGTVVDVYGNEFNGVTGVRFGGVPALSYQVVNAIQLRAVVPTNGLTGPITVYTDRGDYSSRDTFYVAPRITVIDPLVGSVGDRIRVDGANFVAGGSSVYFGDILAANEVVAQTQLYTVVPSGAVSGSLYVVTGAGTATSVQPFRVVGPGPIVLGFQPSKGLPGDRITLLGRKFTGATQVKFNGVLAPTAQVTADTQISVVIPAGATTGPVSVTSPAGTGHSPEHFVVGDPIPVITSFTPASGPTGTSVAIVGKYLGLVTLVKFGGAEAEFVSAADTQITAVVPTNAVTGPITLGYSVNSTVQSTNSFVVNAAPEITDVQPAKGPVGEPVLILGRRFNEVTRVRFGTIIAAHEVTADTQIRTAVPMGATNAPIYLEYWDGEVASAVVFQVVPPGPQITGFQPRFGPPGTTVVISGYALGFCTVVRFGEAPAQFQANGDTQISAVVPPGATTGLITVQSPGGTNSSTNLVFYLPPSINTVTPSTGGPGTKVVVAGANFVDVKAVSLGGVAVAFSNSSPSEVLFTVPTNGVSGAILITTPGGTAVSSGDFQVTPTVLDFSPKAGPVGTVVTIRGTTLDWATAVYFGSATAAFTVKSSTLLEAVVPFNAATGQIRVTTPFGTALSTSAFTVSISSDLSVSIQGDPPPFLLENPLTYQILVTNQGPSVAHNIVVTGVTSAGVEVVSITTSQGSSSLTANGWKCTVPSLLPGTNAICTLVVRPSQPILLTNAVQVQATELDPVTVNNQSSLVSLVEDLLGRNLLKNPEAEDGVGVADLEDTSTLPGWRVENRPLALQYGKVEGYPGLKSPGPSGRGTNCFAGGADPGVSVASQTIQLKSLAAFVDAGGVAYDLKAYLGGSWDLPDSGVVKAIFRNGAGQGLSLATLGPVTANDRTNTVGLLQRTTTGKIPAGSRSMEIRLELTGTNSFHNYAVADNLDITLSTNRMVSLSIALVGTNAVLSWPLAFPGYHLQWAARANSPVWSDVVADIVVVGDHYTVTFEPRGPAGFYQLSRAGF